MSTNLMLKPRAVRLALALLLAMVLVGPELTSGESGLAPLGGVEAAKRARKKRRRFDAEHMVQDMKDTW